MTEKIVLVELGNGVTTVGSSRPLDALSDRTMNVTGESVLVAEAGKAIAKDAVDEAEAARILEQKAQIARISS